MACSDARCGASSAFFAPGAYALTPSRNAIISWRRAARVSSARAGPKTAKGLVAVAMAAAPLPMALPAWGGFWVVGFGVGCEGEE
jgi:hypothetical protein